jgi:hypothetical protein
MSGEPNTTLQRAFDLIEGEAYDEAKVLINSYLATHPYDADAWWLLSHATDDPEEAASALKNVLRMEPNYPRAAELASELEAQAATAASSRRVEAESLFLEEDDFEEISPAMPVSATPAAKTSSRRGLIWLLAAAAIVLVVVAIFILASRTPAEITGSATEVAAATQQSVGDMTETIEPTQDSAGESTPVVEETPAEAESTPAAAETPADSGTAMIDGIEPEGAQAFYGALGALGVIEGSGEVVTTAKGRTLTFSVCSSPSVDGLRNAALDVMSSMAGVAGTVEGNVEAVGVRLVNCDAANEMLRYVVVDVASAVNFASGALNQSSFAAAWDAEANQ